MSKQYENTSERRNSAIRTRSGPDARLTEKILLARRVYHLGWPKQRILNFVDVLDWLMQLPDSQKAAYEAALIELERRLNMPYVNSMVRDAIARGEAIGIERGMQQGLKQGLQQGLEQGLERGLEQGLEQGLEKGLEQGMEQGLEQGEIQGERKLLMKVLTSRFGPLPGATKAQIEQATEQDLSRWADRVSMGSSLGDVMNVK